MQHAAGQRAGVAHFDCMAKAGEMVGRRQSARAAADDQDALAAGRGGRAASSLLRRQIAEKALDGVDADRAVELGAVAAGFAGMIADAPMHGGKRIVAQDRPPGLPVISGLGEIEPGLHVLARRTGIVAGRQKIDIDRPLLADGTGPLFAQQVDDGREIRLPGGHLRSCSPACGPAACGRRALPVSRRKRVRINERTMAPTQMKSAWWKLSRVSGWPPESRIRASPNTRRQESAQAEDEEIHRARRTALHVVRIGFLDHGVRDHGGARADAKQEPADVARDEVAEIGDADARNQHQRDARDQHGLAQADAVRDVAEQRRPDHPAERNHRVARDRFRRRDAETLMQERNAPDHVADRRRHEQQAADHAAEIGLRVGQNDLVGREHRPDRAARFFMAGGRDHQHEHGQRRAARRPHRTRRTASRSGHAPAGRPRIARQSRQACRQAG